MAEKTETPKVIQHLICHDERNNWKVVDIAVVSPTSVTVLLQNDREWCIDAFDCVENEYQRGNRICFKSKWKEPPLFLSYGHVENKLKHFVCTKTKLHLIDDESESIEKSVSLSAEPSALCVEDNKVYISTNETKTILFFKLELPTDTKTIDLKGISNSGSIVEFVVHSKNIYVCTNDGQVSSHKETGEKQHDYRNRKSIGSKASGLAVFTPQGKECNLLLVTWNYNKLIIYSTKTSHDLLDIDLNVLGKIRVTTSCFLMSSEVNDVAVYNMKTVADRAAFKMILVSGCSDRDLSYLYDALLHDTTKVEALPTKILIKGKSLRTVVEMFDNSCTTNENITAEKKKLKHEIDKIEKEKDDVTEELESTRSNLSRKEADLSGVKAKLDDGGITKDTVSVSTENMKTGLRGLIDGILDDTMELTKQKNDVTEELEITKSTLTKKEEDRSQIQVELDAAISNKMDLEKTVKKSEELYRIIQAKEKEIQQLRMRLKKAQTEVENAKTQVTILRDRKQELEKSLSREQKRSKELEELMELLLNVVINLKKVEDRNTKLEYEVTQVKERLLAEEMTSKELQTSSTKLNGRIKMIECTRKKLESQQKKLKDNLVQEKRKVSRKERSRVQLKETIQVLEFTRKELESQQKKLKHNLVQEKGKITRVERSRVQVVKKLKKVEDRNTNLEYEVTQLKERMLAEEKSAKKLQASSPKVNERIKELEFTRAKLESQVKKLKDNLVQEKKKVTREERSSGQSNEKIEVLKVKREKLESRDKKLTDNFVQEKRKVTREERSRVQILETQEDEKRIPRDENIQAVMHSMKGKINRLGEGLSKSKAILNELKNPSVDQDADKMQLSNCSDDTLLQNGQQSVLLKKEASISRGELSEECERLPKEVTLAPFPSDSFKFGESQRHDRYPYWFNDAEAAVSELMDSGVITSNLESDDCFSGLFSGYFDQIYPELKVAVTVSSKGTQMLIPDTGVELYVPGGSLLSRQLIEIKIIDFDKDKSDALFSLDRNSSVAVQLLPNKATLRRPARLRLPHCLRLKANFQGLKSHVTIYRSDHAPGQDIQWEHDPELKYELKEDCCIIFVEKFCSLRYDVIDEAIDATKVTVFTSGKQIGTITELAVGYHVDLPGRRELLLTMNNDMKIFKAKPFEFVKKSTDTLQVHLTTAVSRAQSYEKTTTEVDGKLSVFEAAAKIAELPLDRPKPLHVSDASHFEGNEHISTAMLKVSETVSNKGTTMRILNTGIKLDIPPNAFKGYRYIEMSVVPFGTLDEPISTFSSNSSVIVELLPNRATFSTPVRLSLPHCLKLKKGFSKRSVKVYLSHHEKDQKPFWEELPDAKYELKADHCVIYLTSFCWVKYEIDNKIVVAKRIKVYTATRGMEQNDQIAEVEVGYFIDMPGRAENLRENVDLKISQCKPLLFFKEGNLPLQIFLIKVLPMFWKYSTPDRNPKVIPYKSIADSLDTSLPFVFEKQDANEQKPFAMFRVSQGIEEVEINIRL